MNSITYDTQLQSFFRKQSNDQYHKRTDVRLFPPNTTAIQGFSLYQNPPEAFYEDSIINRFPALNSFYYPHSQTIRSRPTTMNIQSPLINQTPISDFQGQASQQVTRNIIPSPRSPKRFNPPNAGDLDPEPVMPSELNRYGPARQLSINNRPEMDFTGRNYNQQNEERIGVRPSDLLDNENSSPRGNEYLRPQQITTQGYQSSPRQLENPFPNRFANLAPDEYQPPPESHRHFIKNVMDDSPRNRGYIPPNTNAYNPTPAYGTYYDGNRQIDQANYDLQKMHLSPRDNDMEFPVLIFYIPMTL